MSADRHPVATVVNGLHHERQVEARLLLSDFLRHELGLTGTHVGCEHGVCGACTVLVDGLPVRSCLMLAAQADGRSIETVESLSSDRERLHPLQQAFRDAHALQCGFCTPGILMTVKAFLDENSAPSEHDIREALSGNLCRCTGYQHIVDAVLLAAQATKPAPLPARAQAEKRANGRYVGARITRNEDARLLTGQALFVDDVELPRMLHAAFVRSPHAHARILGIDAAAARARAGVVAVYTAAELGDYWQSGTAARPAAADQGHRVQRAHAGAAGQGQGAACRRAGGAGHRREPLPGRGRRGRHRGRLRGAAGGGRPRGGLAAGHGHDPRRSRRQRRGARAPDQRQLCRGGEGRRARSSAAAFSTTAAPRRRSRRAASWRNGTPRATG